jgi:NADPH-dependent 2,4-dienoyl-CoA reductase/sulfur reductase-like enzyme
MIDVAIIGGGPAGIAAALALRARGVGRVAILERDDAPGGVPRYCGHRPFGTREFGRILTGPAYARLLAAKAEAAGVAMLLRHSVVGLGPGGMLDVAVPEGRKRIKALRVLLATGAREAPPSTQLAGVLTTGALLTYVHSQEVIPFARPMVVGTELVGLSALATCRRHGIKPVAVVEAGDRATARWPFGLFPRLLGIPVHYNSEISEIRGVERVEAVMLRDGTVLECDGVLVTGNFFPEASLARASHLVMDAASGGPAIDQYGRCSDGAYFAAGNLLRPIETAAWCFREGSTIADYIADDLAGGLPSAEGAVEVLAGSRVKFVVPQRLTRVTPLRGLMQLRVNAPVRGQLRVLAGEEVLARRHVSTRPERRILLDMENIKLPSEASRIVVEIMP